MPVHLSIHPGAMRRLLYFLIGLELLFVLIFLINQSAGESSWVIHRFFDLDGELNIPAWFSSVQLSLIGILLLVSAINSRAEDHPAPWFLYLVALGFIFLSADEGAGIHETVTGILKKHEIFPRFSGGHGIWIPLYTAAGLSFLLLAWRPLRGLWNSYRQATVIGMAGVTLFLVGGVGLEIVSYEFIGNREGALYALEVALEEFLEMCGGSLMLYGAALFETARQARTRRRMPPAW